MLTDMQMHQDVKVVIIKVFIFIFKSLLRIFSWTLLLNRAAAQMYIFLILIRDLQKASRLSHLFPAAGAGHWGEERFRSVMDWLIYL